LVERMSGTINENEARTCFALVLALEKTSAWSRCVAASTLSVILLNRFIAKDNLPREFRGSDGMSNAIMLASMYAKLEEGQSQLNDRHLPLEELSGLLDEAIEMFSKEQAEAKEAVLQHVNSVFEGDSVGRTSLRKIKESKHPLVELVLVGDTEAIHKDMKKWFFLFLRAVAEYCIHGYSKETFQNGKKVTVREERRVLTELPSVIGHMISTRKLRSHIYDSMKLRMGEKYQSPVAVSKGSGRKKSSMSRKKSGAVTQKCRNEWPSGACESFLHPPAHGSGGGPNTITQSSRAKARRERPFSSHKSRRHQKRVMIMV
jgi:hypothetical protein